VVVVPVPSEAALTLRQRLVVPADAAVSSSSTPVQPSVVVVVAAAKCGVGGDSVVVAWGRRRTVGLAVVFFLFFIIIFAVPPRGRLTAKVVEPTVYVAGTVSHLFFLPSAGLDARQKIIVVRAKSARQIPFAVQNVVVRSLPCVSVKTHDKDFAVRFYLLLCA
jgi:hypothetical protein